MIYSEVGSTGLNVSRIGYGCMSLSTDEKGSIRLLNEAIGLGVNYLDTADIYNDGINETIIGRAIRGQRDKLVIASKAGNVIRSDGGLDWNPSKKHILSCAEMSLKRLGTDYIDLYQLHGGTIEDNIDESIEAFEQLKDEGKIRFYGISSIRPNVIKEYVNRSSIVSVMTQYSLLDRRPEEETLDFLYEHKIGVFARGSVAQGLLINKSPRKYLDHSESAVAKAATAIMQVSGIRTASQSALKYVLQHKSITSAVVGMRTLEQLHDAVGAIDAPDLSDDDLNILREAVPSTQYTQHR